MSAEVKASPLTYSLSLLYFLVLSPTLIYNATFKFIVVYGDIVTSDIGFECF